MGDEELIELVLDGDDDALRKLHDRYVDQLFQYAYTQTSDYYRAEEITQDIMFKMAQNLASFKGKSSFKTWLFAIGRRVIIDYYRKQKKHNKNVVMSEEQLQMFPERAASVEEQVLQNSLREQILNGLQKLPINDRTVLHLRFIQGFSIEETAKAMSKTSLAIKSLQRRARKKLADIVYKEVGHDD